MCTRIKISCYLVTGCHEKLSSSYRWYQKRTAEPMFVRTESLLSRAILKHVLEHFLCSCVHLCWNFSIRRQMAPVQCITFQTANFPIFCGRIIVIFCTTCIAREVFSLAIMGNDKQVLPVLHWLEVVIAFVSSLCFLIVFSLLLSFFEKKCFAQWCLKPGFHYPSWRPELTARVDWWPVSITRQHGPYWRVRVSTSGVDGLWRVKTASGNARPSTRPVLTGNGNRSPVNSGRQLG